MATKFLNGVDLSSQKIVNLASPSAATDGVNKSYVDNLVAGLQWKSAVRAATTTNGALSTAFANGQVIDGVTLATGDRILIKDQTTASENGIYVVAATGAPTRSTDADGVGELVANATVFISEGSTNADKAWTCTTNGSITIGSTATVWAQFGGGQTYTAGNGLALASTQFSVVAGTGIVVGANVGIDTSIVVRKYATNIGDGTSTAITVTHSLNTKDVHVAIRDNATDALVYADVVAATVNTITITFAVAPTSAAYRAVVFA
jgi:hypothetical protein